MPVVPVILATLLGVPFAIWKTLTGGKKPDEEISVSQSESAEKTKPDKIKKERVDDGKKDPQ